MQKSDRNLVFAFTAKMDGDDEKQVYRFHLTMAKKPPSLLPKVPALDLVYVGENLENIDNGCKNKHFQIQAMYNSPQDLAEESAFKRQKDASDDSVSNVSIDVAPIPQANPITPEEVKVMARNLFLRDDPEIRKEALTALLQDKEIRDEARDQVFNFLVKEKKLEEFLTESFNAKLTAERAEEQRQHQALLAKIEEDKQNFLEEHRKAVKDAQLKILNITVKEIMETDRYKKYREAAMNLAATRLESDPTVHETAIKMAQRAILLEKRDGVRIESQRPTQPFVMAVTDEDRAAAAAFVANH